MAERRRRVRSDSVANRERILCTAARLFADRGVDVPLDEIAAVAGVGSATLHRHFRGRLELVHCLLDAEADRLATRADDTPLRTWLLELIRFTMSFQGLAILLADHGADTALADRHLALTAACQRLLASAQADGDIRATVAVGDLLKLTHGVAVAAAGSVELASHLLDLVIEGLRTHEN